MKGRQNSLGNHILHNVDTLEIYEDVIRQAAAAAYTTEAEGSGYGSAPATFPPTPRHYTYVPVTGAQRGHVGGRAARPRSVKVHDPAKAHRQHQHAQRLEALAISRRAEGAAHEAARLTTIAEHPYGAPPPHPREHPTASPDTRTPYRASSTS
jgi:hypothetical protein